MQAGALTSSGASGVVQSEKRSLASAKSPVGARRVRESRAVDGRDESRAHESRVNESRAHGRPRREGGRMAEVSSILGKGGSSRAAALPRAGPAVRVYVVSGPSGMSESSAPLSSSAATPSAWYASSSSPDTRSCFRVSGLGLRVWGLVLA